jgi:drug/metabolite transporter (DMT)-like permease
MLQLHLGVMLLGVAGLFAKFLDLPAVDIIAYRALCTSVVLFFLLKIFKSKVRLNSLKDYKIALALGVLAAVHWVTYFASIQFTSVAVGMITLFTYPVMTVLIEPLLRKQLPQLKDILISLFVLFGISLLFPGLWQETQALSSDYMLGIGLGLISALMFALRNIGIQHYFSSYSGMQGMFYQFTVTALLLLPFAGTPAAQLSFDELQLIFILSVFFSAAPHILFANSIKNVSAKTAGLVAYLQPLYGTILGLILLSEVPSITTLLGGAIVVFAALYETVQAGKKSKQGE